MTFDINRVRAGYPSLLEGLAMFDGAAGTQVAAPVADAVGATLRRAVSNRTPSHLPGRRSIQIVADARAAVADLVGGDPAGVAFGPGATDLTYVVSRALAATWEPGDEVVVSRLDHDANVRPWVQAAASAGATVRWATFDPATGTLPAAQYVDLIGPRTRLVAVTAGSNAIGTVPAVREIADIAHSFGALTYVDGVHATPHRPTDVRALGADFYVISAYKWSGPHQGAVIADPAVWEPLRPAKLLPSSDEVPERFEYSTRNVELLSGVTAAVDHLADLAGPGSGDRRSRLVESLAAAEAYEHSLLDRLLKGLATLPHVALLPAPEERCPTVAFRIDGQAPADTARALGDRGICVMAGDYYAYEYFTAMGLRDSGGAVRVSIYHYNTAEEVDRLLDALA
ncbi:cysteine desulfurase-like protein [Symbioplanes lichenis]|uniref:cysteine desulfurase-like protein n=1 Tax=Symbioplanes lichenis TaxID=1629072 RepID=UPI00273A1D57|nr:cysteine desulfurase-like protein [Actinoplanes lichenis]